MKSIRGHFYDGATSTTHAAMLEIDKSGRVRIIGTDGQLLTSAENLDALHISSRLGNIPRTLDFPDGGRFETPENGQVDQIVRKKSVLSGHLFHKFESHYLSIFMALLIVGISTWWFISAGVPMLARKAAFSLPETVQQEMGRGIYDFLNEKLFTASTLPEQKKKEVLEHFSPLLDAHTEQGYQLRVHFHHSEELKANAIALPSGDIIFTDDMVKMAENNHELEAILLHEIAHIIHRHSLRQAIQTSSLIVAITLITGDISSVSSVATTIPLVLTQLGYSREFEQEADNYALNYMLKHGINPIHFANIMQRMQEHGKSCKNRQSDEPTCKTDIPAFLSTHPQTEKRLSQFIEAAKSFQRKIDCPE